MRGWVERGASGDVGWRVRGRMVGGGRGVRGVERVCKGWWGGGVAGERQDGRG